MTELLSLQQARKLALLAQRVPSTHHTDDALGATLSTIEHLGYIQIDTISVVQRAHHHTLWNRNPRYEATHLHQLVRDKKVFEYWSHAAAYLPFRDYRFSLVRKHALASGKQKHWYPRDEPMMNMVLKRITTEGPLKAKDFANTGKKVRAWQSKPAKRALEHLFMQGDLMIPYRDKFQKVYDLTERVLPEGTNTTLPTREEYARHLITQYLRANGLGRPSEIAYLRKNTKPFISASLQEMVASGEVMQIRVADDLYYALPQALALLDHPVTRNKLNILSPFDNLIIQRKRVQALFGFDYLLECYVPKAKRQYGYFSLPILWDGDLVARMDCKVERKKRTLHIHHLALEPTISNIDAFLLAWHQGLISFLRFNHCDTVELHRTTPANIKDKLEHVTGPFA